jgi:hybrid cluster-associated redox disulfide protein
MSFGSGDLVDDIMRTAPHTIRVFLAFRMACVGCPIATFHTVDDACREHGIDRDKFLAGLEFARAACELAGEGGLSP